MTRIYWALIACLALGITHWTAYRAGLDACETEHRQAVAEQQIRDADQAITLVRSDTKREIRYVTKVVRVEAVEDACIDQNMPADIIDVLGGVQHRDGRQPSPRATESLPAPGA